MSNSMDNSSEVTVPYSANSVEDLFIIEQEHYIFYKGDRRKRLGCCRASQNGEPATGDDLISNPLQYPCPTLLKTRRLASKETRIAVALLLSKGAER